MISGLRDPRLLSPSWGHYDIVFLGKVFHSKLVFKWIRIANLILWAIRAGMHHMYCTAGTHIYTLVERGNMRVYIY